MFLNLSFLSLIVLHSLKHHETIKSEETTIELYQIDLEQKQGSPEEVFPENWNLIFGFVLTQNKISHYFRIEFKFKARGKYKKFLPQTSNENLLFSSTATQKQKQ